MKIINLKFENAPCWPPEEAMNLIDKGNGLFVFKGNNYVTKYLFSSDFKKCEITNVNTANKNKIFKFNVNVDDIVFEGE
jgi:hypothetical protein